MVLVGTALSACIALVGCGGGGSSPAPGHEASLQDLCWTKCHTKYKHLSDKNATTNCIEEVVEKEIKILDEYLKDANTIKAGAVKIFDSIEKIEKDFKKLGWNSDDTDIMLSDTVTSDVNAIIEHLTKLRTIVKDQVSLSLMSKQGDKYRESAAKKLPYVIKYLKLIFYSKNEVDTNYNLSEFIREDISEAEEMFRKTLEQMEQFEECDANRSVFHGASLPMSAKAINLSYMSSLMT